MTGIKEIINDHLKFLFALGIGAGLVFETTNSWPSVDLPEWTELAAMLVVLTVIAGYIVGGKVWDLLPDQYGTFLLCIEGDNPDKIEVWELTDDLWAEIVVEGGPLNHLSECKHEAYEVVSYDDEANRAEATWRKSKENSELVGQTDVTDALDEIAELRGDYEQVVRMSDKIRRRIPSIMRIADRRRARDQNRALEGHTTPSLGGESLEDIITEQLGDLAPERMRDDDEDGDAAIAEDLIDDELGSLAGAGESEAIEPATGDD